jgi:phage repressor protein C with HTH and peptisase S24 domain
MSAGDRLREMVRRAGMNYDDFAKSIGFRRGSSVQRYLDPDREYIEIRLCERIAQALVGRGSPPIAREEVYALTNLRLQIGRADNHQIVKFPQTGEIEVAGVAGAIYTVRDLPIYGRSSGKGDEYIFGEALSLAYRPVDLLSVRDAYAVFCHTDHMAPRYKPGELLYIDPIRPVAPGDDVIVRLNDGTGFVRELIRQTPKAVICRQHNPPHDYEYPASRVQAVHLIVVATRVRV